MKNKRVVKVFALAVLMPMLIMAFAVAPAQAAASPAQAKSMDYKFEKNVNINEFIDLSQVPLTNEQLKMLTMLTGAVPSDLLSYLGQTQYISICGMAHINLKISEECDDLIVDLHFDWHGKIVLLDSGKNAIVTIETKCLQLIVHGSISQCDPSQVSLWLNFQTNSMLWLGEDHCSKPIDLKLHICLKFSSDDLAWIKAQLAQFLNAAIV